MSTYLVLLCYLNFLVSKKILNIENFFLTEAVLDISIPIVRSGHLYKYEPKRVRRKQIRWSRILPEKYSQNDDLIVNNKGVSINEIEELCKKRDSSISDKIYSIPLHKPEELFVELTDLVLYTDYESHVKTEKKIFTSTYLTLKYMEQKIQKNAEILINEAKKYVNELFGNYDFIDEKELAAISNLNLFLDIHGDEDVLLINGRDVYFYIMDVKFSKIIPINIENALENFKELHKHNENIFSEYVKKVYKMEEDIKKYLGTGGNRFPLDYTHWNNYYINITQNVAVRAFMDDFCNYFYDMKEKLKGNSSRMTEVDIQYLDSTLEAVNNIITATIEQKTRILFEILNKLFHGDLKCILGFFTYIFDKENKKNATILEHIQSEKLRDIYDNNFLFDVESLYLEEKGDIKKSLNTFSKFMETNFGFNVENENIKKLKIKILTCKEKNQIIKLFKVIVHELLCRKQILEYFEILGLLKKNSQTLKSYMTKYIGCLRPKQDSSVFINNKKLAPLISKFFEIRERNYCNFKRKDSDTSIVGLIKGIKNDLYRYRIVIKILYLLLEELKLSQTLNLEYENITGSYKKEKEKYEENDEAYLKSEEENKKIEWAKKKSHDEHMKTLEEKKKAIDANGNAILFYLCLIKEFKFN
ncbi:Plasmodium exported protein, unknown function [Plasmodium ovale]|uniref:Fam-f protein n=1 Tax=Plasmodium ovale TaxID=36330 RepID=A0A1C3KUN8_PLAOA|nr:Plasmodium exported protein, unknown function [Plasmodium ovale]